MKTKLIVAAACAVLGVAGIINVAKAQRGYFSVNTPHTRVTVSVGNRGGYCPPPAPVYMQPQCPPQRVIINNSNCDYRDNYCPPPRKKHWGRRHHRDCDNGYAYNNSYHNNYGNNGYGNNNYGNGYNNGYDNGYGNRQYRNR